MLRDIDFKVPAIYIGEFESSDGVYDTFLKIDKFTKVNFYFILGKVSERYLLIW